MRAARIVSRTLEVVWAIGLLVLASGLVAGRLTTWPDAPIRSIDVATGAGCVVLAVLVLLRRRVGFAISAVLILLCAAFDGYGWLVRGDDRCRPGAAVAAFGVVVIAARWWDQRSS